MRKLGKLLAVALLAPLLVGASATTGSAQVADGTVVNEVSPGPQVAVGEALTLTASLELGPEASVVPYFASGSIPDAFEIVSATNGGQNCTVDEQNILCSGFVSPSPPYLGELVVVVELLPRYRAYDQALAFTWGDGYGGPGYYGPPAVVDIVDPTVTADVHAEAAGPDLAVVGVPYSVSGTIISSGSVGVDDVVATVSVDPSLQLDAVTWGQPANPCTLAGGVATCTVGALGPWTAVPFRAWVTPLAPDEDAEVSVSVATTSPVDAPDPYPDTTVHVARVVDPASDLSTSLSGGWYEPILGQPTTLYASARNNGPSAATGVELTVEVPANLTLNGAEPTSPGTGIACTVAGQTATCTIGDLAADSGRSVRLDVDPVALGPATLTSTVTSTSPELSPDPTPNTAARTFTVEEPWLDASVGLSVPSGPILVGQPLRVSALPKLEGPMDGADATVVVEVPEGWDLVSADDSEGVAECGVVDRTATCMFGWLDEGERPWLRVNVVPTVAGPATVTASVASSLPDPDPANDVAELEVLVEDPAVDLQASITQVGAHYADQDARYDVAARNRGTGTAQGVVITAPVPPGATLVSVTPSGGSGSCSVVEGVPTCTVATLAPGATFTARVTVRHSGDPWQVPVEVSVASSSPEPVPDAYPNHATTTIELAHVADVVSGVVRGPGDLPVAGATVRFFATNAFLAEKTLTTNSSGAFSTTFDTVDVRSYAVQIVPPAASGFGTEWYEDVATRAAATPLSLGRQSQDVTLDVRVGPDVGLPSAVSGTVAIDGGVAGTTVAAHLVGDPTPTATTAVGTDGSYAFAALPPGGYVLAFHPPPGVDRPVVWSNGSTTTAPTTARFLVYGAGASVVVPHQDVFPYVSGTVRDRSGAPVANAEVRLFLPGELLPARTDWTDETGAFRVGGVTGGDYQLLVVPPSGSGLGQEWWEDAPTRPTATVLPLPIGGAWHRLDIGLPYANPVPSDVSGSVSVDEGPVEGGLVVAYELGDEWEPTAMTTVGADGSFAFEDLPIGTYALGFAAPAGVSRPVVWSGGVYDRWQATTFSVFGSGAPIALDVEQLVSWGSLSGTVVDGSGAPLAGVEVLAFRPGQAWVPQYTAVTAADGSWSLPEVLPDRYQVLFQAPGGSGLPQRWFDGSALRVSSTWVQVASNAEVVGVDAAMAAWATVSGTVTGPGGVPVAGVRVAAYAPSDVFVGSREVFTDAEGRYVMRWVDPGTYKLRFLPPAGSGLAGEWFDDVATRSAATSVVVGEGAQLTNRDATLAP